jgi:pyruvate,water dikinase
VALAIGGQLVAANRLESDADVFMLTVEELDDLLSGSAMFPEARELVALRARAHAQLAATSPPDSFSLEPGEYWPASTPDPRSPIPDPRSHVLKGLGVCGGQVTSRAAVLEDVSDAHKLQAGDVLITRQTDPGWGAVFPLISGLVIERGGMLSHGAIIAREFGIPSVVGINNATRVIPHGRSVHVDGDRGEVRVDA